LAAEAGEVVGKWAKHIRDGGPFPSDDVIKEVGDVLWFCAAISTMCEVPLSRVMAYNLNKLKDRKSRGVISGSGDER
jgi:NTP pyrophosphatase (non-canonical NTP hydrolase)